MFLKKRISTLVACVMVLVGVCAPIAMADPDCTGSLSDRASSCYNAGPGQPGFHGPH